MQNINDRFLYQYFMVNCVERFGEIKVYIEKNLVSVHVTNNSITTSSAAYSVE